MEDTTATLVQSVVHPLLTHDSLRHLARRFVLHTLIEYRLEIMFRNDDDLPEFKC